MQFDFLYYQKPREEESTWQKLMNIILANKTHQQLMEMIEFNNNEYNILNRNMPFMVERLTEEKEQLARKKTYYQ